MGDNIYLGDRNGVRTPMQWNGGWNAGFSTADPERLASPSSRTPSTATRRSTSTSQKRNEPFAPQLDEAAHPRPQVVRASSAAGRSQFLQPANHRVLAYIRALEQRPGAGREQPRRARPRPSSSTCAPLAGAMPIEMFGGSLFPGSASCPTCSRWARTTSLVPAALAVARRSPATARAWTGPPGGPTIRTYSPSSASGSPSLRGFSPRSRSGSPGGRRAS